MIMTKIQIEILPHRQRFNWNERSCLNVDDDDDGNDNELKIIEQN